MARQLDKFGLVGRELDGKLRIDRAVAQGGFAVVYQATHLMLERLLAVKVLKTPATLSEKARALFQESFLAEAKTMVKITHPNIVQVLDFGIADMPDGDKAPWMALEWIEGSTLRADLMARRGKGGRSPDEALAFLRPAFEALAYAHEEGIAHRDIKPANIMVVPGKRGNTLKVLDFGIAKLMEDGEDDAGSGDTKTSAAMQAFSLPYAAPEQVGATRTGPWTDVHAMALILTEALTDRAPYEGDDRTALMGQVLSPQRPTPKNRGGVVGPFEAVLERALALKPADRYKNAGEMLEALEGSLSDRKTVALQFDGPPSARKATVLNDTTGRVLGESATGQSNLTVPPAQPELTSATEAKSGNRGVAYVGIGIGLVALLLGGVAIARRGDPPQQGAGGPSAVVTATATVVAQPSAAQPSAAQPSASAVASASAAPSASATSLASAAVEPSARPSARPRPTGRPRPTAAAGGPIDIY